MLHSNQHPPSMFHFEIPNATPTRFMELDQTPLVTNTTSTSRPVSVLTEAPVISGVTALEPVTTTVPHWDGTIDKNTAKSNLQVNNQQSSPLMVNTKDILILTPAQHLMLNKFLEYLDAFDRVDIADQLNPLLIYNLDLQKYTPNLDIATKDNVKLLEEIDNALKTDNIDLKNNKLVKKVIKLFKFNTK